MRLAVLDPACRVAPASDARLRDRLIPALRAMGHDVELFAGTEDPPDDVPGRAPLAAAALRDAERIVSAHRARPFDAIHVLACDGRSTAQVLARDLPGTPLSISLRGNALEASRCVMAPAWRQLAHAAALIAPSHELAALLERDLGDARVEVVPNGVPRPFPALMPRAGVRAALGVQQDLRLVVVPGVVRREDRVADLVRALVRRLDGAALVVVAGACSSEDRRVHLEAALAAVRGTPRPRFLGVLERDTLLSIVDAADCCVFPAGEGGRSALLEAALLGTRVVAPPSESHAALASVPWVHLCQTEPDALADRAVHVMEQLGRGAPAAARHLFTVEDEARALLRIAARGASTIGDAPPVGLLEHARARAPLRAGSGPLIVIARGSGDRDRDVAWADAWNPSGEPARARVIMGTVASWSPLWELLRRADPCLLVPDHGVAHGARELVVLVEEMVARHDAAWVAGYGLQQAGVVAAASATRAAVPSVIVLDDIDEIDLRTGPRATDRVTLSLAAGALCFGAARDLRIERFVDGGPVGEARLLVRADAGCDPAALLDVASRLRLPPPAREWRS